jgi:8-oxo-dGTP pyrophosphatase MutT (NUDIX family)
MKQFVLVAGRDLKIIRSPSIVMIEKDRPDWQKGKLNLPGGKLEKNEDPYDCAYREFEEETGIQGIAFQKCGEVVYNDHEHASVLHMFRCNVSSDQEPVKQPGETEVPVWVNWYQMRDNAEWQKKLIPNLRLLIPMVLHSPVGWRVDGRIVDGREFLEVTFDVEGIL